MEKICKICAKPFTPSKYRPFAQEVCSDSVCQHKRELENMKRWRQNNPHYFRQEALRGVYWRDIYKHRIKKWRKEHAGYFKKYREKYKIRHRDYMREYMKRYRLLKKQTSFDLQQQQQDTVK